MAERFVRPSCLALLVAAWIVDLFTPQLLVVAVLFNGPIAMSGFARDPRFTRVLVACALVADASAGYVNGLQDGGRWEAIAVADRTIAALSFLVVAGLSIAAQRAAARAGELAARQTRLARERGVRQGVEAARATINPELVKRTIVREARRTFAADAAILYAFDPSRDEPSTYVARDERDVEVGTARPPAEILSLLNRMDERGERVVALGGDDGLARLRLDAFEARDAIAAALVEYETTYGVLVILRHDDAFDAHDGETLGAFADQVAIAIAQAALFAELGVRNEALADVNRALRERGDVIRDIVYALSHDLRTPLAAARLTMRQALDGAYGPLPPPYREILERSIVSNEALERLAETLLLVSRYESGDRSPRRNVVDLAALARDVVSELEPLWTSKSLAVRVSADDEAPALGDDREFRRAIVNVLANAIAWSPRERSIVVTVVAHDRVVITVDDEGYGVPEAERRVLFERVRAPGGRGAGSGLGLYLVRRIAESHGGTIAYEPRERGSRFTLTLPLHAAAVAR